MSETIFDFRNEAWKIKGVLSAIVDLAEVEKQMDAPPEMKLPNEFEAELIAFIWSDENEEWHSKLRIKFPTGKKKVFFRSFGKDANETKCLHEIYQLPLKDNFWFPNPSGTIQGILEIMKKEGLILSLEVRVYV